MSIRDLPHAGGRLERAAEALAEALFVVDSDERFAFVNRAAEVLVGRGREALLGRPLAEALGPGSLADDLAVVVRRAASGSEPVEYALSYELPSGVEVRAGLLASRVVPGPASAPSDVVVLGRELGAEAVPLRLREEGALEGRPEGADLRRKLLQIERQMARSERLVAVGQMAAGFVHEINNPLGALSGLVQILQEDTDPAGQSGRTLARMASELGRIARLSESMLELARSHSGRGAETFGPVDAGALVRDAAELVRAQAGIARVAIDLALSGEGLLVLGDRDRLHQVVVNLMLNAVQAMSPGGQIPAPGGRLTVSVTDDRAAAADLPPRARRADDLSKSDTAELYVEAVRRAVSAELPPWREGLPLVRIAFEDTGPGIPPEVMDRLFEPFFTTKPGGEGTGLGLSTARAVVRAHGGSLTAANLARGASFVVRLPRLEGRSR